jgi:hypothetical protein
MGSQGRQPPRDPDDWFDEPEQIPPRRGRAPEPIDPDAQTREQTVTSSDDWLAPKPLPPARRSAPADNRRLLVALGIALALLLIGLAAGGVFSGGSSKKTSPPPTRQTTPTTTRQTPTQAVAVPAATLKPGDRGTAVKELQRALRSLGLTVGPIDGDFGTSTKNALIAFQTAHHLSADGVLGPASRAALQNALQRR